LSEPQTNNSLIASEELSKHILILTNKLGDEAWVEQQGIEFVGALRQALMVIGFLSEETHRLLQSAFIFMNDVAESPLVKPVDSDVSTAPTQTSGSRATRRARERVKKSAEVKPETSVYPVYTSRGAENA
jgi:hypothetical protein